MVYQTASESVEAEGLEREHCRSSVHVRPVAFSSILDGEPYYMASWGHLCIHDLRRSFLDFSARNQYCKIILLLRFSLCATAALSSREPVRNISVSPEVSSLRTTDVRLRQFCA